MITKKKKTPIWLIVLCVIIGVGVISSIFNKNNDNNIKNKTNNKKENEQQVKKIDKSAVIYQDNEFLVKIMDYEYKSITDRLIVSFYIENNSNIDTSFTTDNNVSIDDYTIKSIPIYEDVKSNSKVNTKMTLYSLKENNLDGDKINKMRFNLEIYQSDGYVIKNRILKSKEYSYIFKH